MTALLALILLQAIAQGPKITYMPLESVLKSWETKSAAVAVGKDSVVSKTRLGDAIVRNYRTATGSSQLIFHKNAEGDIWDAGLYYPGLHVPELSGYSDYIYATERLALAVFFGDVQYARSIMTLSEIELVYGVGESMDRVKNLIDNLKGFHKTIQVTSVRFADKRFIADMSSNSAKGMVKFQFVFSPTANLFMNGQFNLLQDQLLKSLETKKTIAPSNRIWSAFIGVNTKPEQIELTFPDFKPYGTKLLYTRSGVQKGWRPADEPSSGSEMETLETSLRSFWTSVVLPDSFSTILPIKAPAQVEVNALTRHLTAKQTLTFEEFKNWVRSSFVEVLPVYYGPMNPLKMENNVATAVGSWSLVDPHLKMEHLFKITQKLVKSESGWELQFVSIQATFGIRLDNITELNAKVADGTVDPLLKPFKIEINSGAAKKSN